MNQKEIKKWLIDADLTQAQIAREAKASKTLVSLVIQGIRPTLKEPKNTKARLILLLLKGHGCPPEFLGGEPPEIEERAA